MLAVLGGTAVYGAADGWNLYGNARYGFSVCYPPALLKPMGEPDNSDGNTFQSADGRSIVRAYANYAIEPGSGPKALAEALQADLKDAESRGYRITYKTLKPALYAWSGVADGGTNKGRVTYQKTFVRPADKLDVTLEADYPESAKGVMDPVVARMAACLKGGKGPG